MGTASIIRRSNNWIKRTDRSFTTAKFKRMELLLTSIVGAIFSLLQNFSNFNPKLMEFYFHQLFIWLTLFLSHSRTDFLNLLRLHHLKASIYCLRIIFYQFYKPLNNIYFKAYYYVWWSFRWELYFIINYGVAVHTLGVVGLKRRIYGNAYIL